MSELHDPVSADTEPPAQTGPAPAPDVPLESMTLRAVEAWLVQRAMARCEGNISHAARELGLSRSALYRRLERHGL